MNANVLVLNDICNILLLADTCSCKTVLCCSQKNYTQKKMILAVQAQ